jgi:hypothetical protein
MALKHSRVAAGIDGEILNLESPLQFEVKTGALKVLLPPP